jgi:hypothetical protein
MEVGMGGNRKHVVRLTEEERRELRAMMRKGRFMACRIEHANIPLKADADGPDWADVLIHPRTRMSYGDQPRRATDGDDTEQG